MWLGFHFSSFNNIERMNICRTNIMCKMFSNKEGIDLVILIKQCCLDQKLSDFELNLLSMI